MPILRWVRRVILDLAALLGAMPSVVLLGVGRHCRHASVLSALNVTGQNLGKGRKALLLMFLQDQGVERL